MLGYWADLLERPDEMLEWATARATRRCAHGGVPYEAVVGRNVDAERAWYARELAHAVVTEMPGCGHFPQLAQPQAFAARIAATNDWAQAVWRAA